MRTMPQNFEQNFVLLKILLWKIDLNFPFTFVV